MPPSRNPDFVGRRAEILAEMFLTECGAKVVRPPFDAVDFLAFFETDHRAFQITAVEVKSQETPLPAEFPLDSAVLQRAVQFNFPTLLLVVDVKLNKIGFAWLDEIAKSHPHVRRCGKIRVPLTDAEENREQIRERLLVTATV